MRLFSDIVYLVLGLEGLRHRTVVAGQATPAFLGRLTIWPEGNVFLLISKVIRSRIRLRPVLPNMLARLQASGFYPLTTSPDTDRSHPGERNRVLTTIFNHRRPLCPFAIAYRAAACPPMPHVGAEGNLVR
jgi:hypothetical protein